MELGQTINNPCRRARKLTGLKCRIAALASSLQIDQRLVPRSQTDVDRIHGFRLLVHSEIQEYVESIASCILDTTIQLHAIGNELTHAGHHLSVFNSIIPLVDKRRANSFRYPSFDANEALTVSLTRPEMVEKAVNTHRSVIESNNGVKSSNLNRMLVPIGYREGLFPPGFFQLMDNFGRARGDVAHKSGVVGAANWPSGSSELQRINQIIPGLASIETHMPRLLIPIR